MASPFTRDMRISAAFLVQLGLVVSGMVAFAFAPPAQGKILLVPLTTLAEARLQGAIFHHKALLLGPGPLPGSLIVMEDHENLLWPMLRLGVLAMSASSAGCSAFPDKAPTDEPA